MLFYFIFLSSLECQEWLHTPVISAAAAFKSLRKEGQAKFKARAAERDPITRKERKQTVQRLLGKAHEGCRQPGGDTPGLTVESFPRSKEEELMLVQ